MNFGFVRRKLPLRATLLLPIAFLIAFPPFHKPASAADLRFDNYSFEQDLTGWTPVIDKDNGNDRDEKGSGARITNEQSRDGQYSVRIDDTKKSRAVGLESGKLAVEAGAGYVAFADVKAEKGTAELHLRFYDAGGQLLNGTHTAAEPAPDWKTIQASMTAPAGAAFAAVLLYSGKENEGTAYWDHIRFTKDFTNLGAQVGTSAPLGSTFGIGENQNSIYSVITGNATDLPIMQVIDADTESVSKAIPLPASNANPTGAWGAATASDGTVYFGAYQNGKMYKYVPGDTAITDLGLPLPNQQFVWDLAAGKDGKVYGGTYDDAGFFQYDPSAGFTRIGSMPIYDAPGQNIQYLRSLAHDAERNVSYLAVGANASVIRYDHATGSKTDILPAKYKTTPLAGAVEFEGDRVFVSLGGYIVVLNVQTNPDGSVTATEEAGISGTTPRVSPERDGGVYFIKNGKLARYDIASRTFTTLEHTVPGRVQRFGWITLKDQAAYPGETLVAVASTNNETYLMKYNPQNGSFRMARVEGAPRIPGAINSIGTGPDGNIYTSAFQYGGLGVYRPFAGDANDNQPEYVYAPINQIDKMASYNGKLYLGVYPGGNLFEYDPNEPWNPGVNPKSRISTSGYGQDRPKSIAYGDNRVFMGSTGITNERKGALSVYDYETGVTTVHKDIVTDQSVTALVYHNGLVYGGSSIRGGYSSIPTQTEAKLFIYDPETKTKTAELRLPTKSNGDKPTAITELEVVDGNLWGFAEGYLFVFNPESRTFDYFEEKFPDVRYPGGAYRDADLVTVDKDPNSVYGTIGNKYLFKIDRADKAVTILQSDGADMLTADRLGNLYYKHNDRELWRYSF
ncbi:carbohydrate binding domain-containing protein [Paenibacillus flagellatus]|uniref:carbohydrate binding domain-containing protein n=1 Tax=Paenibacillus flagellatus TaxID=2211139 RepID=UPI00130527B0|nr:carbohydrate binding domain-containing protein [Paenibacillus flagellatus]